MKNSIILCLLLTTSLQYVTGQAFDCHRQNVGCLNHGVCPDDPDEKHCAGCDDGFGGYDCGMSTTSCEDACVNGVCHVINSANACYCNEGYVSVTETIDTVETTSCKPRVEATSCTATSMHVVAYPYYIGDVDTYFAGSVFPKKDPSCLFDCIEGKCEKDLTLVTDPATACGVGEIVVSGGDDILTFVIIIKYRTDFLTDLDQEFALQCNIATPGSAFVIDIPPIAVNPITAGASPLETQTISTDADTGVRIALAEVEDTYAATLITEAKTLGDVVCLVVELTIGEYVAVFLDTLEAINPDAATDTDASLILGGCPDPSIGTIFQSLTSAFNSGKLYIGVCFKVFLFGESTELKFAVGLKLCKSDDTTPCDSVDCTGTYAAISGVGKRKRRQDSSVTDKEMNVTLLVVNPFATSGFHKAEKVDNEGCLRDMVFLIPLLVLVVLLLLATGMALFFCLKVTRNKPQKNFGQNNPSYQS